MRKMTMKKLISLVCIVVCLLSLLCGFAPSASAEFEEFEYSEIRIYVDGIASGAGYKVADTTYIPLRAFFELLREDVDIAWDGETSTATVVFPDLTLSVTQGNHYFTANERCIYLPNGTLNLNGSLLLPIRTLTDLFGFSLHWNGQYQTIDISTTDVKLMASGDEYYNEDDLYWLSRVIYAESGNQSLEGMIGVGNVVLNRVGTAGFADSVYGVIFQPGQFDVVRAGTIYRNPTEEAVVAAKLCLEGVNTVGESLFFINPAISSATWFDTNFDRTAEIGDHVFFA